MLRKLSVRGLTVSLVPAMHVVLAILKYLWASPNTALGLSFGALGLLTGGSVNRFGPVLEFHGGVVTWYMKLIRKAGMTLGYVVVGPDEYSLAAARAHELVHVEQYGRWGPFFLPAYAISSIVQKLKGNNPYLDNFLEVEAYARAPIGPIRKPDEEQV